MERKIMEAINAITLAGLGLLAGILTGYSVLWLWTIFSPRVHFEAGPIGLVCKVVAIATIVLTVWVVPSIIIFLLKNGKKYVRGELKSFSTETYMKTYMKIRRENKDLVELNDNLTKSLNYQFLLTKHYKLLSEEYKKELDSLESDTEG